MLKAQGPIWLGLTERVRSIRAYPGDRRHPPHGVALAPMRSFDYSPLLLAGTVVGLALTFLAPVALALFAGGVPQFIGLLAWLLMAFAFQPTLRFYGCRRSGALALPAIAAVYMAFTARFRLSACARPRRHVERPRPS